LGVVKEDVIDPSRQQRELAPLGVDRYGFVGLVDCLLIVALDEVDCPLGRRCIVVTFVGV